MLCYTYDYTFEDILEVKIMSRSRPASNPISFHKHTKQYYVTRGGKRIYLGSDKEEAIKKYHRMGMGFEPAQQKPARLKEITDKKSDAPFSTEKTYGYVIRVSAVQARS